MIENVPYISGYINIREINCFDMDLYNKYNLYKDFLYRECLITPTVYLAE